MRFRKVSILSSVHWCPLHKCTSPDSAGINSTSLLQVMRHREPWQKRRRSAQERRRWRPRRKPKILPHKPKRNSLCDDLQKSAVVSLRTPAQICLPSLLVLQLIVASKANWSSSRVDTSVRKPLIWWVDHKSPSKVQTAVPVSHWSYWTSDTRWS